MSVKRIKLDMVLNLEDFSKEKNDVGFGEKK